MKIFGAITASLFATYLPFSSQAFHSSRRSLAWKRKRFVVPIVDKRLAPFLHQRRGGTASKTETPKVSPISQLLHNGVLLIGSTTTAVASLVFFGFLAYRRDAPMVTFAAGAFINGILSLLLKRMINQDRPKELVTQSILKRRPVDKGMPSSHAMGLSFVVAFISLSAPWTTGPLTLYTLISLYYRVHVKLHTWQQIGVGILVGSVNGCIWHWLCHTSSLVEWVKHTVLNRKGWLPIPLLVVAVVASVLVIGSIEARLNEMKFWKR